MMKQKFLELKVDTSGQKLVDISSALVQLFRKTAYCVPINFANFSSNSFV